MGNVILIAIAVGFVALVCRELTCWYWKINEGLLELRQLREHAKLTNEHLMNLRTELRDRALEGGRLAA